MARINIEDELRADPRFHTILCGTLPRHLAYGALVCLWDLGQAYWKKHELIPPDVAVQLPCFEELKKAGFVVKLNLDGNEGFYCKGARERWQFLVARSEANRANGKKSAEARRAKFGTAQPNKPERNDDSFEQIPERTPEPPKHSGSGSSSGSESESVLPGFCDSDESLPRRPAVGAVRHGPVEQFAGDPVCTELLATVPRRAQEAWLKTYPDPAWLGMEMRKAYAWIETNPKRAPKQVARFLGNWFNRAYESHRKNQPVNSTAATRNAEVLKDMYRRVDEGKL